MEMSLFRRLLDLIAPRSCAACGGRLSSSEDVICMSCQLSLPRTNFHLSATDNPLSRLFFGVVPLQHVTAFCYYTPGSDMAQVVYKMKYHDRPDIGVAMGRLMASELECSDFFEQIDTIVPVPLTSKRQRQRGYNQSQCLAQGISEVTGLPVSDEVVCRTVFVASQTQLNRQQRQQNVENVFRLRNADSLQGRHVLLVDDVVTTGATATACTRELLKAGGVRVSFLAFGISKT